MTVADNLKSQKVSTFPSARQRRAAKCMEWKVEQTWWKGNKSAANIYISFSLSRKLQERRYSTVHCTTAEQHMYHTLKCCPKPGNDWQNNNTQQWQDGICKHQTNVQVPSQPSMTKQPDHTRTWRIKHQPLVWPNDLYRLYGHTHTHTVTLSSPVLLGSTFFHAMPNLQHWESTLPWPPTAPGDKPSSERRRSSLWQLSQCGDLLQACR